MKHIKTFERTKIEELELEREHKQKLNKIDFDALSKKYKDHFFI